MMMQTACFGILCKIEQNYLLMLSNYTIDCMLAWSQSKTFFGGVLFIIHVGQNWLYWVILEAY